MKFTASFILLISFSFSSLAAQKCLKTRDLPGYKEVMAAARSGNSSEMNRHFDDFCAKNKATITCKTEEVPSDQAHARQIELVKDHACAQVNSLPAENSNQTKLYFFEPK